MSGHVRRAKCARVGDPRESALRRVSVVIVQQSTQPRTTRNRAVAMSHPRGREQQSVAHALMASFVMVVRDELVNRTAQCAFADEDQSIQAGFLDRPHEPLRVGIEIWGTGRQADRLDAGRRQRVSERVAEPWIAIVPEEAFP